MNAQPKKPRSNNHIGKRTQQSTANLQDTAGAAFLIATGMASLQRNKNQGKNDKKAQQEANGFSQELIHVHALPPSGIARPEKNFIHKTGNLILT